MNNLDPREVEKLIGGYATGTLTEAEQQALFSEALGNQALFDALADEEALRDLLSDPVARRQLLATLAPEQKQASVFARFSAWFFRPLTMTLAAGAAAAGLAVIVIPRLTDGPKVEQVALSREAPPLGEPAPQQPIPEQAIVPSPAETDRPALSAAAPSVKLKATPPRGVVGGEPVSVGALSGPATTPHAAPPAPVVPLLADAPREQERKVASARREDAAQAPAITAQAPAPPPPPAAAAPPAPKEAQVQKAIAAKSSFAATVPFEYVLERQGADGSWSGIEPTARLREKDQVRIAVQANALGSLTVDLRLPGGAASNLYRAAIRPGQRFHVPAQGGLSAGDGEHRLVISYNAGVSTLGGSAGFRQRAAAENRSGKAEASSRDEVVAPAPYSVEIPLRFR